MAIPLEGRLKARQTAPFHVQLELEQSHDIQSVAGDIQVQGRAVRVFRTDGRLEVGTRVAFALWVCDPRDEPTGPAYIYFDDFRTAKYMEAYLYGDPPGCKLAGYEFSVIRAPSEQPTLTPRELEELSGQFGNSRAVLPKVPKAGRWWHFWRR
jgi:hypothetical protein